MKQSWFVAGLLAATVGSASAAAGHDTISAKGQKLAEMLDGMDVEHLWQKDYHIDWKTGVAKGDKETTPGGHTHCSAFVAAAADRLDLYILRPPEHGQMWLANAQELWLNGQGSEGGGAASAGWTRIGRLGDDGASREAVDLADAGELVVAVYFQPPRQTPQGPEERPGHIAIVRPSEKAFALIDSEGPDVIQAGKVNHRVVALRDGFADHRKGLETGDIEYFANVRTP